MRWVQLERRDRRARQWLFSIWCSSQYCSKRAKKYPVSSAPPPKLCESVGNGNRLFLERWYEEIQRFPVFHFCFSFKQNLLRSHFGSWLIFLLKVKLKLKMKCKLFQFSSSKMGHLIWEHFPVLPVSSVQQTVWKWQAVPQPGATPEPLGFPQPEREWKFEMRVFLLETEWWHPDLSAQLLHPLLNWITYQTSHVVLCRKIQSSMGMPEACSPVWRETG